MISPMKKLLALAALLTVTGCATTINGQPVVVGGSVTVSSYPSGYPVYYPPVYYPPRCCYYPGYIYSPNDSGPFGYSPEVQARGSYYTPQMIGPSVRRH